MVLYEARFKNISLHALQCNAVVQIFIINSVDELECGTKRGKVQKPDIVALWSAR